MTTSRRVFTCAVSVLALAMAAPALAAPNIPAANTAMAAVFKKSQAPGAGFAVASGGSVVNAKGFGYANVAQKTAVSSTTMFALASCSKPLTAMAIMKLVDERKISLSTPAFSYLGFATTVDPRSAKTTVWNLLNHSSGLPHDVTASTSDPMDTARAAAKAKLLFTPGKDQAYSNAGFNVLGAIVEKASGMKYIDFVKANVFAPAGVTRFGALEAPSAIAGQAVRYDKHGKVVTNKKEEGGTPAGGWILAPADYVRILAAYDAGKIVSTASRTAMLAPPVAPLKPRKDGSAFGLGWDVVLRSSHDASAVLYGKNGGINGASTWVEHTPGGVDFAAFYNGGNGTGAHRPGLASVEKALGN